MEGTTFEHDDPELLKAAREEEIKTLQRKAEKYDELYNKIAKFYDDDWYEGESEGLGEIGLIAASHYGFI